MKKGTAFDICITREEALYLIKPRPDGKSISEIKGINIMCEEYGDDEEWCGIETEDYDMILSDSTYSTFEIWLEEGQTEEMISELLKL